MMNVTNDQIRALATEAAAAGDLEQVAICRRALGEEVTGRNMPDAPGIVRALRLTVDEARAECARVIADAAAQE